MDTLPQFLLASLWSKPANRACMLVWHWDKCSLEHRLKPPTWYHMGHQPNPDLALCRWAAVELTCDGLLLLPGWWSGFLCVCVFFNTTFESCCSPQSAGIYQPQSHPSGLSLWTVGSYLAPRNGQATRFLLAWCLLAFCEGRATNGLFQNCAQEVGSGGWPRCLLWLLSAPFASSSSPLPPTAPTPPSPFFVSNPDLFRASNSLSFSWIQSFNLACGVLALPASCFGHYFQLEGIKRQQGVVEGVGAQSQKSCYHLSSASK